jgi:gamma-glutamyl:cysteine ligase YbdK (ATP-grasp superfamily)
MQRPFFNVMAHEAKVPDWIEAFTYGQAKASGPDQFLKLIRNVVERQQERQNTRRAHKHEE